MTLTNQSAEAIFTGNGLTTEFASGIVVYEEDQLRVYLREGEVDTLLEIDTHYTLSALEDAAGATVTMLTAPETGQSLVLVRYTPRTQETSIRTSRAFNGGVLETRFDLTTMTLQEITQVLARCYKVRSGQALPDDLLTDFDFNELDDIVQACLEAAERAEAAAAVRTFSIGDELPEEPEHRRLHWLTVAPVSLYVFFDPDEDGVGTWVDILNTGLDESQWPFQTRADLVAWADDHTPAVGTVIWAGGYPYLYDGDSETFDDLPNYTFVAPAYLQHWGMEPEDNPADCTVDYTEELRQALSVVQGQLLFTGWVKVTDALELDRYVRLHSTRGHNEGGIAIFDDFNLSADAVLTTIGTGEGGIIDDFGVWCEQPASPATRSDLIHYPPILDLSTETYLHIGRLRIRGAWDGLYASDNFGGLNAQLLEICAFNKGVELTGALSFCNIETLGCHPFGIVSNAALLALYEDETTIGAQFGRLDGGKVSTLQSHAARVVIDPGYNNLVPFKIEELHLDGDGARLTTVTGRVQVESLRSSKTSPSEATVHALGGETIINLVQLRGSESVMLHAEGGAIYILGGYMSSPAATTQGGIADGSLLLVKDVVANIEDSGRTDAFFYQDLDGVMVLDGLTGVGRLAYAMVAEYTDPDVSNYYNCPGLAFPQAANNAAAIAMGLPVGSSYHTVTGEVRVVI